MPSERAEGLRHLQRELLDLGERLPGGLRCITGKEAAVSHASLVGFAGLVNELGTIRIWDHCRRRRITRRKSFHMLVRLSERLAG